MSRHGALGLVLIAAAGFDEACLEARQFSLKSTTTNRFSHLIYSPEENDVLRLLSVEAHLGLI